MTAQRELSSVPDANLAHKTSRGTLVTAAGLWGRALLQTASTVVLARLLDPTDFGLLAMITAIVGVADLVRDFGLTAALIQSRTMTSRLWSSALWLSLLLGVVLSLVIIVLAPAIALLYDEPQLVLLTVVIAPTLVVNGLAMPMQAKLQRELRFTTLAHIDVGSMLTGVILSIGAALLGWGVWSLVLLAGSGQFYRLVALWISVKPRFGPPRISREMLPLISIGGSVFGVQVLNYAARNLDNVIIGSQLGSHELGYYSRAYALFLLPLQQLNGPLGRVALPVLSSLSNEHERFRSYIRGAVLVIGYLTLPSYAVAAAVSQPLIAVLLGPGWEPAAMVFSLLAVAGIVQAVGSVQGWLYLTLERVHRQLVYYAVTRPVVIGGFFLGIWWAGINGVALIYSATTLLLAVPGFWFAIRGTFVRGTDIAGPLLRPFAVAIPAFLTAFATVHLVEAPVLVELLAGISAGILPIALALSIPAYRRDLGRIAGFVSQVRQRRGATPGQHP